MGVRVIGVVRRRVDRVSRDMRMLLALASCDSIISACNVCLFALIREVGDRFTIKVAKSGYELGEVRRI